MTEIGGPSQVPVDEIVDKHVVLIEQPVVEPMLEQETHTEVDPEEDRAVMAVEPVRGGVMRFSSDDDEDDDQMDDQVADSDDDGTEDERDEEPVAGEDRIRHLEEQNQVHQDLEGQYRDLAYQTLGENAELVERRRSDERRIAELEEIVRQKDQRIAELQAQLMAMSAEYDLERMDRINIHEAWLRAATRVDEVEAEYRACEARVDRASLALNTAFGRLRSRVRRYGREEHHSRRVISRSVVDQMAQREHERAVLRADL